MRLRLLKIVSSTYTIDHELKKLSGFQPRIHADYARGFDRFGSKGIRYTNNQVVNKLLLLLSRITVRLSILFGIGIGLFWKQAHVMYLVVINRRRAAWLEYLLQTKRKNKSSE